MMQSRSVDEPRSMPLELRIETGTINWLIPDLDRQVFSEHVGLLFNLVLTALHVHGFISRMLSPPKAVQGHKAFHTSYAAKLLRSCTTSWLHMTSISIEQHQKLCHWMEQKFSLDPRDRCRLPSAGYKRKPHKVAGLGSRGDPDS